MSGPPGADLPKPLSGATLWIAAGLLGLANFTVILDTTIANVSVPHIAGGLAVSPTQGTWVITSYAVAEAISVPLTGWLSRRFGVVRVFLTALCGFGLFSLMCGLSPTFGMLVAARICQGLCGGPIMPTSQILIGRIFPPDQQARGMAVWAMTTVIGPVLGPILGGNISDNFGWNWIFLINVPVVPIIVIIGMRLLRSQETKTERVPVDYIGLLLMITWIASLQMVLDRGKELDWFESGQIVAFAVVAVIGFIAFLIWELTAENPIVDVRIFRHRGFVATMIVVGLGFGTYFSSIVLVPLWLQTSMGYTATMAGYATAGTGLVAMAMSPFMPRLMRMFDPRAIITAGLIGFASLAFWRGHFTTDVSFWHIAVPQILMGLCMPCFFVPTMTLMAASVQPREMASAAGLQNFIRTMSTAFATSIMTTSWDNAGTYHRSELAGSLNDVGGTVSRLADQGFSADQAIGQIDRILQVQAVMLGTNQVLIFNSTIFLLAAMVVWMAPNIRRNPPAGPISGGH